MTGSHDTRLEQLRAGFESGFGNTCAYISLIKSVRNMTILFVPGIDPRTTIKHTVSAKILGQNLSMLSLQQARREHVAKFVLQIDPNLSDTDQHFSDIADILSLTGSSIDTQLVTINEYMA